MIVGYVIDRKNGVVLPISRASPNCINLLKVKVDNFLKDYVKEGKLL